MKALRVVFRLGLLIGLGIQIPGLPTSAQTASPKDAQPTAPGLRKLTDDDARRAEELDKAIEAALKADRWDEAIARAEELLALPTRAQGAKHFETVDAEWRLKTLHRVASMPKEDRVAYQSASTMNGEAATLSAQGKYAQAQPLLEKALDVRRRLRTDDHPLTASIYENVAVNLDAQGKHAQAQPLFENAADPDGEHWGVVVRSRGIPAWVPIAGTGSDGHWTKDDTALAARVRTELRTRPGAGAADLRPLVEKLRTQRLDPLAGALGTATDGLPPARRLIVLPSRALAGIPVEALLAPDDTRTVSYAPSATVFKYLREQPGPDHHAGLLALGDPVYDRPERSSEPKPMPDHGLLVNLVAPGSNAATHGLKPGDILLAYNGTALRKREDLKAVPEPGKPVPVEVWRNGRSSRLDLDPGELGLVIDPRPAPEAITEQRKLQQVLVAARSGDEDFDRLPGTRYEVEALARLFKSDDRPTRTLLAAQASEPEMDRLSASGELGLFGFIHLATHGVIDEDVPARSAVILTQTDLPDPLQQALSHKPVFDGRLSVREIQRGWDLKAELVTLSACETALGRDAGGESFVGFTQALRIDPRPFSR